MLRKRYAIEFWREAFWEFIQNLVLLTGFFLALALWRHEQRITAILCIIGFGVAGAWNIRFIERAFKGHQEPLRVTLANSCIMPALMGLFVAYLAAGWSTWKTDVPFGMLAGMILATIQRLAIKAPLDIARFGAFVAAFPLTLLTIRRLSGTTSVIATIAISTTVATLLIVIIHQLSKNAAPPEIKRLSE